MSAYDIKLPAFLTVEIESASASYRPANLGWWRDPVIQFIVLKFGQSEIGRWEWQADRPLEERTELEDDDKDGYVVTDFVATKLREILFPKKDE